MAKSGKGRAGAATLATAPLVTGKLPQRAKITAAANQGVAADHPYVSHASSGIIHVAAASHADHRDQLKALGHKSVGR